MGKKLSVRIIFLLIFPTFVWTQAETQELATKNINIKENDQIIISNPFYLPYKGSILLGLNAGYLTSSVTTTTPAQTFLGIQLAQSEYTSTVQRVSLTADLSYGIFDRFIIGVIQQVQSSWTNSNAKSVSATDYKFADATGITEPTIYVIGRLGGLKANQVYLDIGGAYSPGFSSKNSDTTFSGRHKLSMGMRLGLQIRSWSAGVSGNVQFQSSAVTNGVNYAQSTSWTGQIFTQYDLWNLYLRLGYARSQYFSVPNDNDPLSKLPLEEISAQIGIRLSENSFWYVSGDYVFSIQTGQYYAGYFNALLASAVAGPIKSISSGVSLRF